jgi:molybdate transport system substrate-binding protein
MAPRKPAPNEPEETNIKQAVANVQLGKADAGIVYSSDVTPAVRPAVRVIEIPN